MPESPSLFEELASFENLYRASMQARKGKRFQHDTARFHHDLGLNLVRLRDELLAGTYQPGPYRTFLIYEPARRYISAAPYRDRVVHHAICNAIEPIFERGFVADSYANRIGKGTHRALDRCTEYARRYRYVLQCDIRLFFPSIDHDILMGRIARKVRDPRVLSLCRLVLGNSNPQPSAEFYFPGDTLFTPSLRRKGLPIGNLTSQFWANVYLDPLDHLFRDDLDAPYIRYVDDWIAFSNDKETLERWRDAARTRLEAMRLLLHARKTRIFPVDEGIAFLGFRVFPGYRRLLPDAVGRARRRLGRLQEDYECGRIGREAVRDRVRAWIAHAKHGDTRALRRRLLSSVAMRAGSHRCGAGRVVEQQS